MRGPEQGYYPLEMHCRQPDKGWYKWRFIAADNRLITAWNREARPPVNLPFHNMVRVLP